MVKFWAGALGGMLLFASGIAHAERPKILVLPVTGKTADAGFRQRVGQALSEGLFASGGEVVALPTGAAALPPEGCTTPACLAGAARATGAAFLLRAAVDEEGRSYEFKLEMLDGQSGAVLAQRENRCEICTDSEALEIANASASALKAQALKRPAVTTAAGPPAASVGVAIGDRASGPRARVTVLDQVGAARQPGRVPRQAAHLAGSARPRAGPRGHRRAGCVRQLPLHELRGRSADRIRRQPCAFHRGQPQRLRLLAGHHLARHRRRGHREGAGVVQLLHGPTDGHRRRERRPTAGRPPRGAARTRPGRRGRRARCIDGAAAEGNGGSGLARVLLGAGVAAVGAAGIVAGSFTWHRAGTETDCFRRRWATHDCTSTYEGKNLGIGMVVGGAILAGVGGYLMIFHRIEDACCGGPRRRVRGGNLLVSRLSFAFAFALMLATIACNPKPLKEGYCHEDADCPSRMCNKAIRMCYSMDASVDSPEVGDVLDSADGLDGADGSDGSDVHEVAPPTCRTQPLLCADGGYDGTPASARPTPASACNASPMAIARKIQRSPSAKATSAGPARRMRNARLALASACSTKTATAPPTSKRLREVTRRAARRPPAPEERLRRRTASLKTGLRAVMSGRSLVVMLRSDALTEWAVATAPTAHSPSSASPAQRSIQAHESAFA